MKWTIRPTALNIGLNENIEDIDSIVFGSLQSSTVLNAPPDTDRTLF